MTKNKKAAMEMSVGTIVTIVLLMTVLVLGLVLVRNIFASATKSVDSIDDQVRAEINNLFASSDDELVVLLGSGHRADVQQGENSFGFGFGYSPDDPAALNAGSCLYSVSARTQGKYCSGFTGLNGAAVEDWITTGINNVEFDETKPNAAYAAVILNIPEGTPICVQRFSISVDCAGSTQLTETFFDINVVKKGIF